MSKFLLLEKLATFTTKRVQREACQRCDCEYPSDGVGSHRRGERRAILARWRRACHPTRGRGYAPAGSNCVHIRHAIIALLKSRDYSRRLIPNRTAKHYSACGCLTRCVFRDRSYGLPSSRLHLDCARWCKEHVRPIPASRRAFERALQDEGFTVTDGWCIWPVASKADVLTMDAKHDDHEETALHGLASGPQRHRKGAPAGAIPRSANCSSRSDARKHGLPALNGCSRLRRASEAARKKGRHMHDSTDEEIALLPRLRRETRPTRPSTQALRLRHGNVQ